MKTLCRVSDGVSLYIADDIDLLATLAIVDGRTVSDRNAANSVVYDDIEPPEDWNGGDFAYDGTLWTDAARATAKRAMLDWINGFLAQFTTGVADSEPLYWDRKEAVARSYAAGAATAEGKSIIEVEAALTGEKPDELAALIIGHGVVYSQVMAITTGLRRDTAAKIDAAEDLSTIPAILADAQAKALSEAAKLNIT